MSSASWRRPLWRLAIGAVAIEGVLFVITTRRFLVEGRSMLPALKPGDRVAASRYGFIFRRPRPGHLAVVRAPDGSGRLDVKRLAAGPGATVGVRGRQAILGPQEWFVTGDNAAESSDSRTWGPVHRRDIVGKVWFKY